MASLATLVAPESIEEFLGNVYAKSWAYFPGHERRFSELGGWDVINSILETQRFDFPRFRVVKEGAALPSEGYTEKISGRAGSYRRLIPEKLLGTLRDGGTLILDHIDQAITAIRDLAFALEAELRASVFVNAFASWSPVPGFNAHWDDHDVFVVQLEGSKHWKVYEPTRRWPRYRDIVVNSVAPDAKPLIELDISAGDVLYVPHGWWHSVSATSGPSLHLAVGVTPSCGIDFLSWLMDRAHADELFRQRVPTLGDEVERDAYLKAVRKRWNELMAADNILDQFITFVDGTSPSRPTLNLPEISNSNNVLDRKAAKLVPLVPRATVSSEGAGFVLIALGRRWFFPALVRPLIDLILSPCMVTVGEAIAASRNGMSEEQAATVIFTLLRAGLVALR
jgi:JmjC domain